ncbi:MAG: phytanoyl-CoA dioxygenase family protein [Planctomycetes bacterium]|nr:phytanoyl-CoA dioxygenase family protein [Planctomycetota bacterium]
MSSTLETPTPLSNEQLARYREDGFLILRNVFSADEMAALEAEASALWWRQDLVDKDNIRCRWKDHVATGECTFECFDPVIDISPVCERFARDPRVLRPLQAIYGSPAHLFKDKLIFKPPGTLGYNMHQDYIGWANFPESFITVLIAIDPADDDNGATEVFPGYHRQGYLSPKDGMYHDLPESAVDLSRGVRLDLQPGDIALFGAFTPHRSAPNQSDRWRRQLYLSYSADHEGGDQRDAHYREFHAWLVERYAEYGKLGVFFK